MTLVVPVRDEVATIDALATSIAAQSFAPDAVVLVDGGSTDGTVAQLRPWLARQPTWRVIEAGPATPGRGRNVGIAASPTEWLALADAGMTLDQHWLARLVEAAQAAPDAAVVFGHVETEVHSFVARSATLAYVTPPRATERGPVRDRWMACSLLRRDAWEAVGGFPDLRAAEDLLFLRAIEARGMPVAVAPEARLVWQAPDTFVGTFRRLRRYSRVNAENGLQSDWHHGVARQWMIAAPFLLGARWWRPLALVPAAGFAARTVRSVLLRREGRSILFAAHPVRLAGVAAMLLTCDAATFVGWADAWRGRRGAATVPG